MIHVVEQTYIAIDLKSFYASVECVGQRLDPLTTNLVVADESRTEKTICLAVSPALKEIGIPGRPRLFEVVQKVKAANRQRQRSAPRGELTGASINTVELKKTPCSPLTTSWQSPGWPITWSTARASSRSTPASSHRRTSTSILSTRFSWM